MGLLVQALSRHLIRLLDEYTSYQQLDTPEIDLSSLPPLLGLVHRLAAFADCKFPRVWRIWSSRVPW